MFPNDELVTPELTAQIESEMAKGERVVWVRQPIPWRTARASIAIVLFGIPWTAFSVFWIAAASAFKVPDFGTGFGFFPLFGIPFVLIGLGMLSSPFWMLRKARRTAYVITNQRAIIVNGGLWNSVTIHSLEPARLTDLRRTQYPDGSGNLVFQRRLASTGNDAGQLAEVGFMAIPDVKEAENQIRELVRLHDANSQVADRAQP